MTYILATSGDAFHKPSVHLSTPRRRLRVHSIGLLPAVGFHRHDRMPLLLGEDVDIGARQTVHENIPVSNEPTELSRPNIFTAGADNAVGLGKNVARLSAR